MAAHTHSPPGLTPLQSLFFARRFVADPRAPITECTRRFGPIWRSLIPAGGNRRGLVPLVWLMGRDGNERILSPKYKDDFTWYDGYCFTMEPLFGRRILLLLDDEPQPKAASGVGPAPDDGQHHRTRHRVIVPAFHPRLDDEYLAELARIVDLHLSALDREIGRPIDLQEVVKAVTFHVVASLLLGAPDADPQLDRTQLMHQFEELGHGLFSLIHLNVPGLPFHRALRARAVLVRYLQGRLDSYREGRGTPPPMLRNLLAAQQQAPDALPDDTIIAELISFLYAGYDTTASLMTSVVAALGNHPAVYGRVRDDLSRIATPGPTPSAPTDPSPDDGAQGSPFLNALLLECERLYPPLLFLMRGVRHDLSFGGYDIAAGSKVAYSPYYTGRMPELFPDPERFQPERFLDSDGTLRRPPPYTLLGFGGGHRMCIGKRLASLELRMFLTQLLSRYDLTFPDCPADGSPRVERPDDFYFNPALQRRHGYRAVLSPRRTATRPAGHVAEPLPQAAASRGDNAPSPTGPA